MSEPDQRALARSGAPDSPALLGLPGRTAARASPAGCPPRAAVVAVASTGGRGVRVCSRRYVDDKGARPAAVSRAQSDQVLVGGGGATAEATREGHGATGFRSGAWPRLTSGRRRRAPRGPRCTPPRAGPVDEGAASPGWPDTARRTTCPGVRATRRPPDRLVGGRAVRAGRDRGGGLPPRRSAGDRARVQAETTAAMNFSSSRRMSWPVGCSCTSVTP